jgi:hypothetical protein
LFPERRRFFLAAAAIALALSAPAPLLAQSPPATIEVPMRDPWVPPSVAKEMGKPVAPTEGAALRAQVERKLKAAFDAAAKDSGGTLTREQARAAGLGFIANHFDAMDRGRTGLVRFEDYLRFLRDRDAEGRSGILNR